VPQRKAAVALAVPLDTIKQNWPTTFTEAAKNGHAKPAATPLPASPIEQPIDAHACLRQLIRFVGDDPDREGLKDTPDRVVRSYAELFAGYQVDPASVLKTFKDGACDELVLVKGISFTSFCEHHMLPFFGEAHVAYIPKGRIVGLSKLARLVEVFARRLQVQERLTEQITAALDEHVKPKGSACVIEARHACMMCRGVKKPSSVMVTSSLTGQFRDAEVRQEFLSLIRGR
jgi:GTP cyclohydrolase I